MVTAATAGSGDITDMDCSSAEIEELIKEVRALLILNPTFTPTHPLSHLMHFITTWLFCHFFFLISTPCRLLQHPLHRAYTLPHDLCDYEVCKVCLVDNNLLFFSTGRM